VYTEYSVLDPISPFPKCKNCQVLLGILVLISSETCTTVSGKVSSHLISEMGKYSTQNDTKYHNTTPKQLQTNTCK